MIIRSTFVLASLAPACFGLTGCKNVLADAPEIEGCRRFTMDALRSPSTYKEVSSRSERDTGANGVPIKTITLVYDAANVYGTPVRGIQRCDFVLSKDGKVDGGVDTAIAIASADRALGKSSGTCCLPAKAEGVEGAITPNAMADMPDVMDDMPNVMDDTQNGTSPAANGAVQ